MKKMMKFLKVITFVAFFVLLGSVQKANAIDTTYSDSITQHNDTTYVAPVQYEMSVDKVSSTNTTDTTSAGGKSTGNANIFAILKNKIYTEYNRAFVIVEEGQYEKNLVKVFPKSKYLSIRYNGYHKDAPKYYKKLDEYIIKNNYEIIDDSIEIQLVDPSLITCESEMVSEIQIPVRSRLYD